MALVIAHQDGVVTGRAALFHQAQAAVGVGGGGGHRGAEQVGGHVVRAGAGDQETAVGDHHGAPYSLTEDFATVYRMHPLIPDDYAFFDHATGRKLCDKTFTEIQGATADKELRTIGLRNGYRLVVKSAGLKAGAVRENGTAIRLTLKWVRVNPRRR